MWLIRQLELLTRVNSQLPTTIRVVLLRLFSQTCNDFAHNPVVKSLKMICLASRYRGIARVLWSWMDLFLSVKPERKAELALAGRQKFLDEAQTGE